MIVKQKINPCVFNLCYSIFDIWFGVNTVRYFNGLSAWIVFILIMGWGWFCTL